MTNYYNGYRVHGEEKNISIINFLKHILKYWYIILSATLLATTIAYIYTTFFVTPMYRSTAKLYILTRQSENITTSDFSVSNALGKDYMELIDDVIILEPVSDAIGGKYSAGQIKSFLSINNPENTRFLEITITSPNPKDSQKMVNLVCKISQEVFVDVLNADKVTIVREGRIAQSPSSPNLFKNLVIGGMIGALCSVAVIFLLFTLNDTIKFAEDVEKALDLNVLATIPFSSNSKSYY